jgi:hypothetical protein
MERERSKNGRREVVRRRIFGALFCSSGRREVSGTRRMTQRKGEVRLTNGLSPYHNNSSFLSSQYSPVFPSDLNFEE